MFWMIAFSSEQQNNHSNHPESPRCPSLFSSFHFQKHFFQKHSLSKKFCKETVYQTGVFVVTVIARNRINGVGSLFFRDRILRFGKNMPQSLKRFELLFCQLDLLFFHVLVAVAIVFCLTSLLFLPFHVIAKRRYPKQKRSRYLKRGDTRKNCESASFGMFGI